MNDKRSVLVLNAGSSSLKFAILRQDEQRAVVSGQVGGIGEKAYLIADGQRIENTVSPDIRHGEAFEFVFDWLSRRDSGVRIDAAGHRIVHGGTLYSRPVIVDDTVEDNLKTLLRLAPLHMPAGVEVLARARRLAPKVPQVACFDTAFHATQPEEAVRLPLPRNYHDRGYRRYGFHGLNYEHVVAELQRMTGTLPSRLIVAHLGQGASMCALKDGKSIATTMGYSTADGLIMGTRTGSVDPGLLIALQRDDRLTAEQLEELLYRRSGLLGLSGISSDMKVLLISDKPEARQAVEQYCYWAARHAGSLAAALQGLDALVFTGGIGENAAPVRAGILDRLGWLGITYDSGRNRGNEFTLSPTRATCSVYIVPANEELVIARHVFSMVA